MQKEFLKVELDWPVNRALRQLRRQAEDVERVYNIFVTDEEEHLLGVLSLKRLLIANSTTKIAELYNSKNIISVKTSETPEQVAAMMEKYDLVTVPPSYKIETGDQTEPPHKSHTARKGNTGARYNSLLGALSNSMGAIVAKNNKNTKIGRQRISLS